MNGSGMCVCVCVLVSNVDREFKLFLNLNEIFFNIVMLLNILLYIYIYYIFSNV